MYFAEMIADFALGITFEELPEPVVTMALTAIADTLACGIGAVDEPGPGILRDYARLHVARTEATLLGGSERVDATLTALVNCSMVRDLDANDLYAGTPGRDTGHFSDAIPALLAVAEANGNSGRELITAVAIAYEVQGALAESYLWMKRGLHSVSQVSWAIPAAAGRLIGLSKDQIVSAIGLSGTTGGLILQSWLRPSATLPLIKGGAPGFAAKQALESTELAGQGFTAPVDALETLFERLPSEADPSALQSLARPYRFTTTRNMLKRYPAQIYTQAAVQAAVAIQPLIENVDQIAVATVYGHRNVAAGVQGSAAAYTPATRGAADHSTPFVVAVGLRDGDLTPASYAGEPWLEEDLLDLMRRVDLVIDPEYERGFTQEGLFGCRLVVEMLDGQRFEESIRQQQGHPDNPLVHTQLIDKMRAFADWKLGSGAAERIYEAVQALPTAVRVDALLAACRP